MMSGTRSLAFPVEIPTQQHENAQPGWLARAMSQRGAILAAATAKRKEKAITVSLNKTTDDQHQERIETYREEASRCTTCREPGLIYRHADGRWAYPLFQKEGTCRSGVMLVLEAPNFDDTFDADKGRLTCEPETDPTGQFMSELLASVQLEPSDVLFTNCVLCLPAKKNGKFPVTATQRKLCRPWLVQLIDVLDPGVVGTVGGDALRAVGQIEPHGLTLKNDFGRLHDWLGRKLLPLYHPSRLGRVNRSAELQQEDIKALLPFLGSTGWRGSPRSQS